MNIVTIPLGDYQTNCYIITSDHQPGRCLIIDPGQDPEPLMQFLQDRQLHPEMILLTHGHGDHIAGVDRVFNKYPDLTIAISEPDAPMLTSATLNLSASMGYPFSVHQAQQTLREGDTIEFGDIDLQVLATAGHTPGGLCFYCSEQDVLFSGDTLFAGSVGRSDFPNGSHEQLIENIQQKLMVLPDNTRVYPGHGPDTTIKHEKIANPFL